jgi:hypothetical protein
MPHHDDADQQEERRHEEQQVRRDRRKLDRVVRRVPEPQEPIDHEEHGEEPDQPSPLRAIADPEDVRLARPQDLGSFDERRVGGGGMVRLLHGGPSLGRGPERPVFVCEW